MKIEYNNLYTHFVFTTRDRQSIIQEKLSDTQDILQKNKVIRSTLVGDRQATKV